MPMDQANEIWDEFGWGGLRARATCSVFISLKQFKCFRHRFRCHNFTSEFEYELI